MARKAIVDREIVLQLLREGKTSQAIASQYGVSRQAIDLYRKQFVQSGLLPETRLTRSVTSVSQSNVPQPSRQIPEPAMEPKPSSSPTTSPPAATTALSLDQMVDLIIQAFSALKRVPELETEIEKLQKGYDSALQQVEQLRAREQKRQEQETRWIHAQSPGIVTSKQE